MSLYGALYAGVSGLQAQSTKIGVISNNISNVNTVGYKGGIGQFETLVTGSESGNTYAPGGVIGIDRQSIDQQGLLQSTSSATDIAIQGKGFFVVNSTASPTDNGQVLYTRAGSFTQDATGNFKNSAGYFLQAWPLDRNGNLPGAPGNLDTTSSANLSSLQTVNVQNLSGTAAATTSVALGANLDASQTVFPGAAGTVSMDKLDTSNYKIKANDIIVPNGASGVLNGGPDNLQIGDSMTVSTGSGGLSDAYTYGGFTYSRDVTSSSAPGQSTTAISTPTTIGAHPFTFTSPPSRTVTVNASPVGLAVGDVVTLAGNSTAFDGLSSTALDGQFIVSAVTPGSSFQITLPTATAAPVATSITGATFGTTNASNNIVITGALPTGLVAGDRITLANTPDLSADGIGGGAGALDGTFTVTAVNAGAGTYTIQYGSNATGTGSATAGGTATSFVATGGTSAATFALRNFAGNILDANSATTSFLGTSGISNFTNAALSFTITSAENGTSTFSYTSSSPNTALGQFNNLTNLADAINNVNGLTARVVNGRIYIGASNADAAVTFANGATTGTSGPPLQAGIDWVGELGLANVASASNGVNRFSTQQGLADLVNASTGLTATVENPLGDADVKINVNDPLATISFTDGSTNSTNQGSLLAALGLVPSLNNNPYVAPLNTGTLGPIYDPTNPVKNMASGAISAQFSRTLQVYDGLGTAHNLSADFIKTSTNTWAVEVYATPASAVNSSLPNGQLAYGTLTFNGDGSLRSVSSGLSQPASAAWTDGAAASAITFDWGTAGQPFGTANATTIGKTDGVTQFDTSYAVNFANQNGTPVGQLTAVNIDTDGYVIANYSNGETQKLYKIPLATFADADQLESSSGNVFAQTASSGEVNLTQAGNGGTGTISADSLESSNVELSNELTDMIIAQRAYEANTKVITTTDHLLQTLNQMLGG